MQFSSARRDDLIYGSGYEFAWGIWVAAFAAVVALYIGIAAYALTVPPDTVDGNPDDAINVELMPDPSPPSEKIDDVAGPKVAESAAPTSEQSQAEDPDPPAPDAAPPTETQRKPDTPEPETAPVSHAEAEAILPPPKEIPKEKIPDPKPPDEKALDAKVDKVEHQTAPSQASSGSTSVLSGGRRPSAAAKATWRGEVGSRLARLRRYPREARANGWQGTARVRVKIDAEGHVLDRALAASSGRSLLDEEALDLVQRSDPFPRPPDGMPAPIEMTIPVNFAIR